MRNTFNPQSALFSSAVRFKSARFPCTKMVKISPISTYHHVSTSSRSQAREPSLRHAAQMSVQLILHPTVDHRHAIRVAIRDEYNLRISSGLSGFSGAVNSSLFHPSVMDHHPSTEACLVYHTHASGSWCIRTYRIGVIGDLSPSRPQRRRPSTDSIKPTGID